MKGGAGSGPEHPGPDHLRRSRVLPYYPAPEQAKHVPVNSPEAEPPLAVPRHHVRERVDSKKNESSSFRSVCRLGVVLLHYCQAVLPHQSWEIRLGCISDERMAKTRFFSHSLSAYQIRLYVSFRSLFAPKTCVPVTRSDWPASIRITVHHTLPSSQSCVGVRQPRVYLPLLLRSLRMLLQVGI